MLKYILILNMWVVQNIRKVYLIIKENYVNSGECDVIIW